MVGVVSSSVGCAHRFYPTLHVRTAAYALNFLPRKKGVVYTRGVVPVMGSGASQPATPAPSAGLNGPAAIQSPWAPNASATAAFIGTVTITPAAKSAAPAPSIRVSARPTVTTNPAPEEVQPPSASSNAPSTSSPRRSEAGDDGESQGGVPEMSREGVPETSEFQLATRTVIAISVAMGSVALLFLAFIIWMMFSST